MRAVKSVSIDSARRVIITYLDGSTETLYPNCIWCDSEALRDLIKDLLEEKADAITQTIENVTVATFSDGADEGIIKKLLVSIEPIQEGTGDPSPENVRPISGRAGLTVFHSGADTSGPTTISVNWETEAGTVYGGSLDVVSGKLVVDRAKITLDGTHTVANVVEKDGFTNCRISGFTPVAKNYTTPSTKPNAVCSDAKAIAVYYAWQNQDISTANSFTVNGSSIGMSIPGSFADADAVKAYLTSHNVNVCYEIATPTEIQLTPQEITTLLGDNSIWADSGNILELEYTADTKLYISEQQSGTSGTLGSGRQEIVNPDIQTVSEKTLEDVEAYKEEATDERGE